MRYTKILGHTLFFIHFFLAYYFVMERSLYADSANFIFTIINEQTFSIGAERFTSVLPQLLPLLFVKLGLSLKTVLYSFSLSYVILYYGLFLVVVYHLKNPAIGFAMALSLVFCVDHNYFMSIFEMTQGVMWCFVLYAFLKRYYEEKYVSKPVMLTVSLSLVFFIFLMHPASIFSILFIVGFMMVDKKKYFDLKLFGLVAFVFGMAIAKSQMIQTDSYEGNFMSQLGNFGSLLPAIFTWYSTQFLGKHFMDLYFFPFIILFWTLYGYYKYKSFLKLLYTTIAFGGFLLITLLVFHSGDSDMMMERVFIQLSIFILIPLMHDFYSIFNKQFAVKFFFLVFIFMAVYRIGDRGNFYHRRVAYIGQIISAHQSTNQSKFIIASEKLNPEIILVPWAFSMETMLYSALNGPDKCKTFFIADDPLTLNYPKDDLNVYLYAPFWLTKDIRDLNQSYFKLPRQNYSIITK